MTRLQILRFAILVATVGAGLLQGLSGITGVLVGLLVWIFLRPEKRQLLLALPLFLVGVSALVLAVPPREISPAVRVELANGYLNELLEELDEESESGRALFSQPPTERGGRLAAFALLEQLASREEGVAPELTRSWLLFDPDGEAVAWAGRGLLHDVTAESLPLAGALHIESFTAHTFLAIQPLGDERRAWRLGVGLSLPSDRLPGVGGNDLSWSVAWDRALGNPVGGASFSDIGMRLVAPPTGEVPGQQEGSRRSGPGMAFLVLALLLVGVDAWRPGSLQTRLVLGACGVALAWICISYWALPAGFMMPVVGAAILLLAGPVERARDKSREWIVAALMATVVVMLLWVCLVSTGIDGLDPTLADMGWTNGTVQEVSDGGSGSLAAALALFVLSLAALWAARSPASDSDHPAALTWGLAAGALLVLGAAAQGWTLVGLVLSLAGAWLAICWARRAGWRDGVLGVGVGIVLSALLSAVVWEIGWTRNNDARLQELVEIDLAPPAGEASVRFGAAAAGFFRRPALEDLAAGDTSELEAQDLAFALWRSSPLARYGVLSVVSVGPPEAPISTFAYGLPTTASGQLDDASALWTALELPGWDREMGAGSGVLTLGGGPWTTVEYRYLLRPGFGADRSLVPTLAEGLLRRQAQILPAWSGVPEEAMVGIYRSDGSVAVQPWRGAGDIESGPLPEITDVPGGRARTFWSDGADARRVAYLRLGSPMRVLEKVALHAAMPLAVSALVAALWFVLSLTAVNRRQALKSGWRSFSKRLVVLYTLLLIVPILVINVLVLRVFSERLETAQRAAGQAALESAQSILGDYVFSLEPGFGIDTAIGDDVMLWLSGVVHHEVNLYWGSRLTASSKRELFSSGLLPLQIPGEIFAHIALEGADLASRTTRAGGAVYEEFYAPLEIPGIRAEDAGLFVSIPLLAQEVARAREMAAIRNRVLLAGIVLAIFLLLLGRRVARSFTRPLLQIVEGTQAIASGAPSIDVEVSDSEFITLVDAIDEMAARIAAARTELLREKQVVDRMIDNITSAVVSVDREGNVLLINRTAHDMLGVLVGEPFADALERQTRLDAITAFVRAVGSQTTQETVRLADESSEDGAEEVEWTVVWVPLASAGDVAGLFVLEDVTEVLRGQRLNAWAEMARMIAHEVKNPLTPIRLSAEHLREVRRSRRGDLDEALEQCTANILRQVDELQQIVSDFSAYSKIPEIDPQPGDVAQLVESVVNGYSAGGPEVVFSSSQGPWTALFDAKLLSRAIRNLLENAVRAIGVGGRVEVDVVGREGVLEIRVVDDGGGIAADHLPRIFEPYFSTEAAGTGLGLPIARRIVEEHGGEIVAHNVTPAGLEVVITLPRLSPG